MDHVQTPLYRLLAGGVAAIFVGAIHMGESEAADWSCGSRDMPTANIPVRAPMPQRMTVYLEGVWQGRTSDGRDIQWFFETDEQRPIPNPKRVMWIDKTANHSLVGSWRGSDHGAIVTYTHRCDGEGRNCSALAASKEKEAKIHPATFRYFCHARTKFRRAGF